MNNENIPEEIFDLLGSKSFEKLTDTERALVLQYMNEDDYKESQTAILSFKEVDNQIEFNERSLPIQKARSSSIIRFATYRVPIYQVAAGLALMAMVTYGVDSSEDSGVDGLLNPKSFSGQSVAFGNYPDSLVFNL